ncbi:MAG: CPBP family intramembrane metalloprotease [Phycisphaerae bacterium]|nr:CPBP family intramembrane metalloprotease [Phycisphaerae bacterium]
MPDPFPPGPFASATSAVLDGSPPAPPVATGRLPDPGSPRRRTIAWALVALLTLVVAVVQRLEDAPAAPDPKAAAVIQGSDVGEVIGKLFVKLAPSIRQLAPQVTGMYVTSFDDQAAQGSAADRVWSAVVAGELMDDAEATKRLTKVREEMAGAGGDAEAVATLLKDVEALELVYSGRLGELSQEQKDGLVARHGFFGKVALTRGLADTDPARAPLLAGAGKLIAIVMVFVCVLVAALLAGLVLFIVAIVQARRGRLRPAFRAPAAGGSLYLETVALFLTCFLLLQVGLSLFVARAPKDAAWVTPVALASHWLLALVPLYAMRGRTFADLRRDLGWTSGRGVLREVGAGVAGYLAGLPLFLGSAMLAVLVLFVYQMVVEQVSGQRPPPPTNPLAERLENFDGVTLVLFFTLATVWAPIVEEAIFRGTLFRHLRGTVGPVLAAMGSAFVFGIIHPVPVLLTIPLMTLGFNFAMMREWRGSLIAPMTAHCVHNATVLSLVISVMSVVKD